MAGVAVGLAGAGALLAARRRAALSTSGAEQGARSMAIIAAGLVAIAAALALFWRWAGRR